MLLIQLSDQRKKSQYFISVKIDSYCFSVWLRNWDVLEIDEA